MSLKAVVRTWPVIQLTLLFLSSPAQGQPTDSTAGRVQTKACQCLLLVNYNMQTGRPCLNIISTSEPPSPVVCETEFRNDTTVYIILHLPYTWPDRGHRLPDTCFPARSFHLYLATKLDSAHYFVEFDASTGQLRANAIEPAQFIEIAHPKAYPVNTLLFQIAGNDHQLAAEISQVLQSHGEERLLEPGYYYGIPRRIRVGRLGTKQFNETDEGLMLAIELDEPLDRDNHTAVQNLVDAYHLTWFYPGPLEAP